MAAGALGTVAVAAGCNGERRSGYDFLADNHAQTLAAICDQIIPADDYPSASQAGVIDYIDRQLSRHYRPHREAYIAGLAIADALCRSRCGCDLAAAPPEKQQEVVAALEQHHREFFDLVRKHTMEGFYGSPRHGGNRDAVSWRMLGLPEPPLLGRAQYALSKGSGR